MNDITQAAQQLNSMVKLQTIAQETEPQGQDHQIEAQGCRTRLKMIRRRDRVVQLEASKLLAVQVVARMLVKIKLSFSMNKYRCKAELILGARPRIWIWTLPSSGTTNNN